MPGFLGRATGSDSLRGEPVSNGTRPLCRQGCPGRCEPCGRQYANCTASHRSADVMPGDNWSRPIDLALQQLQVLPGLGGFEWFNAFRPALQRFGPWSAQGVDRTALIGSMSDCLYQNFYCVGGPQPYPEFPLYHAQSDDEFVDQICDAAFSKTTRIHVPISDVTETEIVGRLGGLSVYLDRR